MFKTVATIRPLFILLACSVSTFVFATDITFIMSGSSPYCAATSATVTFDATAIAINPGNTYVVELSDAAGSFSAPAIIGTLSSSATTGSIDITFPSSASGANYRVRIRATDPATVGSDNGSDLTIVPPVTPTIDITADPSTTVGAGSVVYFSSSITEGGTSPQYQWRLNSSIVGTSSAVSIPNVAVGDKVVALLTSSVPCSTPATSNIITIDVDNNITKTNHAWEPRATQTESASLLARTNGSGFSIGNKGYIGCGSTTSNTYRNDFWEYDPATDAWTQKANFGGVGRYNASGFSVGAKGFIGMGVAATGVQKDLWQYDPTTNTWLQRQNYPGQAREQAFAFTIGTKGYLGGGYATAVGDFKDFYEFDPGLNTWTARADFGGGKRMGSASFSIDAKGFVAGGYSSTTSTYYNDLWDYDQANNYWTQRASMPGNPRTRATGFALAGNGYVGLGYSSTGYEGQFFQYTLATNTWSWKPYYPGPSTHTFGAGMTINNRAFVYKDGTWTEYNFFTTPSFASVLCSTETVAVDFDASGFLFSGGNVFTAQISTQANFSVSTTLRTLASIASSGTINATIPTSANGVYYFRIVSSNPLLSTLPEILTITQLPSNHVVTPDAGTSVCKGALVTFSSNQVGSGGFQWYKNNVAVGTDAAQYSETALNNNDAIKCIRTYTAGCKSPVGVASIPVTMTVKEAPKPTISLLAPNTLTSSNAVTYQWYHNGDPISRANSQSYLMTSEGAYKVRVTDNAGCFAFSDEVVDKYVGLEDDIFSESISAYPNPLASEMILEVHEDLVAKGCMFSVLNQLGQTVVVEQKASQRNKINLGGQASGLYMVRLVIDGATVVRRVMKVE